uniref:SKP1 component dimerisation domain-containing protein n=2 Tax=Chromera velia CCMP2878 TaxID=1169474 RepID=A0A0G4HAR1_9ALVE|eukprot:Cvel_25778.t1-p1 / transcript=Cvel_25778.t1 / gene=Cvel_25778 / organism=Chromera_velia_CCMP2878 / gene_product=hypothetical protein / transcript_product=hypothetical protein / location=Cvel_scaffold2970:13325-21461(-) / protein_length=504 / sequence_SO=supercontig / SO=protein_coding / is_pseudo=false
MYASVYLSVRLFVFPSDRVAQVVSEWDANFVKEMELDIVVEVLLAANFLHIESLLDLCCLKLACMTREKRPKELKKLFKLEEVPSETGASFGPETDDTHTTASTTTLGICSREKALGIFLHKLDLSKQMSALVSSEDSFGLAWLGLYLIRKQERLGPNAFCLDSPVRSIDVSGLHKICDTEELFEFLPLLPASVEEMKLGEHSGVGVEGCMESLGRRLESLDQLKKLSLEVYGWNDESAKQIFSSLPASLEQLELRGNHDIGSDGWKSLDERLKGLKLLKKLNLAHCHVTDEGAKEIFSSLPALLEELEIQNNMHIGMDGWRSLGERLKSLDRLKTLDLSCCDLNDESAIQIFPSFPAALEKLDLYDNMHIGMDGWRSLGERLKSLDLLKTLDLSCCNLTNESAGHLFPSLSVTLEELHLYDNWEIGFQGWASLCRRLENLDQLKKLNLERCNLTNESAGHLFPLLPASLEELDFSYGLNHIDSFLVTNLRRQQPNLTIIQSEI